MALKLSKKEQVRQSAEASLETFIRLIHPQRVLGQIHQELIQWSTRSQAKSHQLILLPRDHQKSTVMGGYRAAWEITRNPAIKILYISSTSNLAEKQLGFIKGILTSDIYRLYWPEMVHPDEGKRTKWTTSEFTVDHPERRSEAVRDPTVFTAGLTTSITGLHCDLTILDDVVVYENAYTEEGRDKVRHQYSLLSSIEGTDAREIAIGTRYHPNDLYSDLIKMEVPKWNEDGDEIDGEQLFEVFKDGNTAVENRGDGTGEFLWPRQQRPDGKWFGFDAKILARKKAQYLDRTQFRAQYYNDPNDYENASITRDDFQYYNKEFLNYTKGHWFYKMNRLNVFAAIDFAYSLSLKSDYTSIVVIGIDGLRNVYVLDIDRFKTQEISEYFRRLLQLHQKWDFHKVRAECTAAQEVIARDLKSNYIQAQGLALTVDMFKPTRHEGTKEERMDAILQHRYANKQVWHYQSGNCQILEDELLLRHPPHDDVKDALSNAIDTAEAPTMSARRSREDRPHLQLVNSKFGGIF